MKTDSWIIFVTLENNRHVNNINKVLKAYKFSNDLDDQNLVGFRIGTASLVLW